MTHNLCRINKYLWFFEREGFCLELDVESVVNREISRRLSLDTVVSQLGFQIIKTLPIFISF